MRTKARQTLFFPPPRFSTFLTNKPRLCAAAFLLSATFFTSPAGAFPTSTDLYKITEISAETYNTAQANQATDVFAFSSMDESGKAVTKYYQWLLSDDMFTPVPTAEDAVLSLQTTNADGSVTETHYKPAAGFTKGYTTEEGGELQDQRGSSFPEGSDLDIKGNFIGYDYSNEKSAAQGGGLRLYNRRRSNIDIHADFINNSVRGQASDNSYEQYRLSGGGGAAFVAFGFGTSFNINELEGDFIGNSVQADYAWGGGLFILSENNGTYDSLLSVQNINGNFISNHIKGDLEAGGGALANRASAGEDQNEAYIKKLNANFINNYAYSANGNSYGGALANGTPYIDTYPYGSGVNYIESINGNFINNHVAGKGDAYGGAVYNNGYLRKTSGIFSNNYAYSAEGNAFGGAIASNLILNASDSLSVMIYKDRQLSYLIPAQRTIDWDYVLPDDRGATVSIAEYIGDDERAELEFSFYEFMCTTPIESITAESISKFVGIPAEQITAEELDEFKMMVAELQKHVVDMETYDYRHKKFTEFYNASFFNNRAISAKGDAYGGAIYGTGITIVADNYTSVFDGNTANGQNNAIYAYDYKIYGYESSENLETANTQLAESQALTLQTLNGGIILFNDAIDGENRLHTLINGEENFSREKNGYTIEISGDKPVEDGTLRTPQYVKLNNSIANAGNINIANTTLSFGEGPYGRGEITADGDPITKVSMQNAAFDLYNGYTETVNLKGWNATDSYLHVDVDVENLTADMLNINGNVEGTTLYPTSAKHITGESIVFATATNDTKGTEDSFTVYRVYRSPYMFKVDMTGEGTTDHEWYLTMTDEKNEFAGVEPGEQPDPEVPDVDIPDIDIPDINVPTAPVYGEVVAYGALPAAALEQTHNMVDNVGGQVAASRTQDAAANYNLWVNPTYYTSNIDSPFAIDADIWGIEAGGDIQRDIHNRLGVFFSYRQGEYDMNGNGDRYYSTVGSEIDIDSYIAGLYYRYDHNNWYAFATLYGGIQEADIKTDDGMKSDTDGVEFGASAEVGYDYALTDSVTLTPELGVFYTQVNYDDASDNVGKSASYDDARQIELEAGVKLAKTFMTDESFANVYVKPSVVQTIVDGDEVSITGLGDVEALDDATLGRIEIGGRYGFTTNLSAYGWANYTFGSDYDATTFGLGLNYAF